MGLLDKVKDKATQATEMAKDAAAKGQAKLDEAQAKKAADGMLRDLGAAFYATKTGRATPTTDGRHRPAGGGPAAARVGARRRSRWRPSPPRPPRRRPRPASRRIGSAVPSAAAAGGGPRLAATSAADRADAVGRRPGARPRSGVVRSAVRV